MKNLIVSEVSGGPCRDSIVSSGTETCTADLNFIL